MGIKVTEDRMVYKTLEYSEARLIFSVKVPIYILYEDNSLAEVKSVDQISAAIIDHDVVLKVGKLDKAVLIKSDS